MPQKDKMHAWWHREVVLPLRNTPSRRHVFYLLVISLASLVISFGYLTFVQANNFLPSGIWGLAAILRSLLLPNISMGVFIFVLNVPILIWGWKRLDIRFALYTLYGMVLQSVLLIVLEPYAPSYTNNILLACIFGGVLGGAGSGLIIRYHGSSGGTEVVGIILKEKYDISVGSVILAINAVIVLIAAFMHGFEIAMYTMVYMTISSMVFSKVLDGLNSKRNVTVITTRGQEMAAALVHQLGRGVTIMSGVGAWSHAHKDVLLCVVSRFQVAAIKEVIRAVDAESFVMIQDVHDVMGHFPRHAKPQKAPFGSGAGPIPPLTRDEKQKGQG